MTPPGQVTGVYTSIGPTAVTLDWDALRHLILPALVLAAFNVSLVTRFTRSAILE